MVLKKGIFGEGKMENDKTNAVHHANTGGVKIHGNSSYDFYNFSVSLNLFQNKKLFKKASKGEPDYQDSDLNLFLHYIPVATVHLLCCTVQ